MRRHGREPNGMTLSDYLLRELRPIADLPRLDDVLEEVRQGPLVDLDVETAELIRLGREENDDKMVVAGASALVDALIRRGVRGDWAAAALAGNVAIAAPHLVDPSSVCADAACEARRDFG